MGHPLANGAQPEPSRPPRRRTPPSEDQSQESKRNFWVYGQTRESKKKKREGQIGRVEKGRVNETDLNNVIVKRHQLVQTSHQPHVSEGCRSIASHQSEKARSKNTGGIDSVACGRKSGRDHRSVYHESRRQGQRQFVARGAVILRNQRFSRFRVIQKRAL